MSIEKRKLKKVFIQFAPYEGAAMEEYLENMALKGWMLDFVSSNVMNFKPIAPKKIKYQVDILDDMQILDEEDSISAIEYREYCERVGWHFIDQNRKIQFFYRDDDKEAVPIKTDDTEKFKSIVNASLSGILGQLLLVVVFRLYIYMEFSLSTDYILTDNFAIVAYSVMMLVMIMNFIDIINFIVWVIKSKVNLKKSKSVKYNSYKSVKRKNIINIAVIIAMIILYTLCFIVDRNPENSMRLIIGALCLCAVSLTGGFIIKRYIRKSDDSRRKKSVVIALISVICVVLCIFSINAASFLSDNHHSGAEYSRQEIILTLEDFGIKSTDEHESMIIKKQSLVAGIVKYMDGSDDKSLWYDDFRCDKKIIYDFYLNWLMKNYRKYTSFVDISNKFNISNGEKVYSMYNGRELLLKLDGRIIFINNCEIDKDKNEVVNKILQKVEK